jgi:rhodanese-related sulfurtransferase
MRTLIDVAMVVVLAVLSLGAGLAMNRFAAQPLPIVYQSPEQRFDKELTTLVTAAPFAITPAATVGLQQFRAAVEGKTALIFDARPADFFARGHVPGALNLSRDDFAHDYRRLAPVLKDNTKPIIVYCSGGACHDSKLVANALLSLGSSDVSVYTGGWDEWSTSNLPTESGSAS